MSQVKPIPEGFSTVTPSITMQSCSEALDFYTRALGAEIVARVDTPDGRVLHAELRIGSSRVMLNDEFPEMGGGGDSVQARGGSPVSFWVYVEDCDAAFRRAVDAGCAAKGEPSNQFWGDRSGWVVDPYGLRWTFATRVEEVSPQEREARQAKLFSGG